MRVFSQRKHAALAQPDAAPGPLTRDQVITAFELMLGRRPVDEWEIGAGRRAADLRGLVEQLIGSDEFRTRYEAMIRGRAVGPARPAPILLGDRVLAWTRRGQRIYLVPQDVDMTPHILLHGTWEAHVEQTLLRFARPGSVVIDLGSNVGYYTIALCSAVEPSGRVYAFEPHPQLMRLLQATLFVNGLLHLIELHACAASDGPGNLILASSPDHYGSGNISPSQPDAGYAADYCERVEVPAVTLDAALGDRVASVDLMHLDIEGAEPLALRGAQSLIERSPNLKIVTEWSVGMMAARANVGDFVAWLDGLGFRFWRIDRQTAELSSVPRDAVAGLPHGDLLLSRTDPG